jgi:histidinol-phosphate aminotransferase
MMGLEVVPSRANFIFFETPRLADELAGDLLRRGVIVRPCGGWGYERSIRVTVGTEEENNFFLEALEETLKTSDTAGSGPMARGEDKNGSIR